MYFTVKFMPNTFSGDPSGELFWKKKKSEGEGQKKAACNLVKILLAKLLPTLQRLMQIYAPSPAAAGLFKNWKCLKETQTIMCM